MTKKTEHSMLDLVPVANGSIKTEKEEGRSVIAFPRFKYKLFQKMLVPLKRSPLIRIKLDEYGSQVWGLINGERTVGEICEAMSRLYPEIEDIQPRTLAFIGQLNSNSYIRLLKAPEVRSDI